MSAWSKILSPDERAEVEGAVTDAYVDSETGEVRTHIEAKAMFVDYVRDARQAHKAWAGLLLSEWSDEGAGRFAARLWSNRDTFTATVSGTPKQRRLRRGVQRRSESGALLWTQDSILTWSIDDFNDALLQEARRVQEGKDNLSILSTLIQLLDTTEAATLADALTSVDKTLEEYLEERLAA